VSYASRTDALCYPGTTVLRNKAGLQDQEQLDAFELAMVITRAKEIWPSGALDAAHYLSMHRHLFQDVYDRAGTIRTIRIGKDGSWFCFPEHIESEMEKLFGWLAGEGHFQTLSGAAFAAKPRGSCRSSMRFIRSGKETGGCRCRF
jgi:cell filamentation protein